ncbi:hypothetical protein [Novilysobacter defluvii]|uniref:hypothetical protein n=1 Tax=Novilysobacter defluvii TaxID=391738 RepID=UPI0012B58D36|nr:hypothetical protein [Lysobacter defluvii]
MLDAVEYEAITALAKKAGVVRPYIVQALLAVADEAEVVVKARQIKAEKRADSEEARKKRDALAKLASNLDIADLEALIKQVQGSAPPERAP